MKFQHVKAPSRDYVIDGKQTSIFLAGAIDMGNAEDWQTQVARALKKSNNAERYVLFNPRRDDWDSSWVQTPSDLNFNRQVRWELDHLEKADLIVVVFPNESKAPISFLELGLMIGMRKKVIICCGTEFYRRGNLLMLSNRYDIEWADTIEQLVQKIKRNTKFNDLV